MKMKLFVIGSLLTLLCGSNVIGQTTYQDVPVQFVTEHDIQTAANDVNYFNLRLCGGCLYDHKTANVFINLPKRPWEPILSNYVEVYVYDSHNHLVKINKDSKGNWIDTFPFHYDKSLLDLKIQVTTPNTVGGIIYSLTVRFADNTTVEYTPSCQPRYVSTIEEEKRWKDFEEEAQLFENSGNTYELVSIYKLEVPGMVITRRAALWELNYCFQSGELPGHVDISVIAIDEKSGFSTNVCPGSIRPCQAGKTKFSDISGAAVNFVKVDLTQVADNGPIQIILIGDGRYEQPNKYTLAASKYQKNNK